MALIGRRSNSKKPVKGNKKVASISDVNAATSSIEEEPTEPQLLRTKGLAPETLTGDRVSAYGEFNTETYSEESAKSRQKIVENPDEFDVSHEVGVIYVDENAREFYFDEYGSQHFSDEVEPSPDIPASFEEARHSSSRERFRKEAESARQLQMNNASQHQNSSENAIGGYGGGYANPVENSYPAPTSYTQPYAHPAPDGINQNNNNPPHYEQNPQSSGFNPINHGQGVNLVDLRNAEHVPNPFAEGSHYINEQISQGTIAENFPSMATTIASLVNSSKTAEEISTTLLGYLQTTIASEGSDAAIKLLGTDNIYTPLLVSALIANIAQRPIDPVALRDVWKLEPEIKIEEKIVYVKDNFSKRDGEKGFWVSLEDIVADKSPIFDGLEEVRKDSKIATELNYAKFDY